jgi:type IV secretory pathway VirJ component
MSNKLPKSVQSLPLHPLPSDRQQLPLIAIIYSGDDERESLCTELLSNRGPATCRELPGDHHFDHDYSALMKTLDDFLIPEAADGGSQ